MTEVLLLDGAAASAYAGDVFALYDTVFGDLRPETTWRDELFDRHRARDGYRLAIALDRDRLQGFAWGYRGERGQFWPDLVARTLPDVSVEWIGGHFELVDIAVRPDSRGSGIGRRLHDALLAGLSGRALLGTSTDDADPAVRLYESCGWQTLGLLDSERRVMGVRLPTAPAS